MNPILASEGRRRMRSWRTPVVLTAFGALLLFLSYMFQLSPLMRSELTLHTMSAGVRGHVMLLGAQFALIVMVAPIMTAGSIAGERERQTLDLLLVTNSGSLRIVLGKLMENFAFLALLIVGMMPISCAVLLYGSISLAQIAMSTLFLLTSAFAALSVGMLCSVLFKRTVTAAIIAYLAILGIGLFTLVPLRYWRMEPELVQAILDGKVDMIGIVKIIPPTLWINPGLGLISLVDAQTNLLMGWLKNNSYGFDRALRALGEGGTMIFAWINMGATTALGLVLVLISAALVRPRSRRGRARARVAK